MARRQRNRSQKQFVTMIFTQVIATAVISLPWAIIYLYSNIPNSGRTSEQQAIVSFVSTLANYIFFLNYVKSFYVSILTSRVFRQKFRKVLAKLLPFNLRPRFRVPQANMSMVMTVTKSNQPNRRRHIRQTVL